MALTRTLISTFFLLEGCGAVAPRHSTPGFYPFGCSSTPGPYPSSPFRMKKTYQMSEPTKARKARQSVSSHPNFSKQTPCKKKKKSHFPLRHYRKAGYRDFHDSLPEPGSSQDEAESAGSPPSSPVLCELGLPSVTFPAHPEPELPANESFHAGRHNHPAESHVNFPLPY